MKPVSAGKLITLTLITVTTIGSIVMAVNTKEEDVTSGAAMETAYVEDQTFSGSKKPEFAIPYGDTSFKSYMDFRCITNARSDQYRLQQDCWTDAKGLRRYNDDYVVALGSYYADNIGDRFEVTLESGVTFTVIIGDFKADADTDATNRYNVMSENRMNVLEFIVDTKELDSFCKKMGDISYAGFKGNILEIRKLS